MPRHLTIRKLKTVEYQRIFSKIQVISTFSYGNSPCWVWTGSKSKEGYAHISFRGRHEKAHRVLYAAFVDRVPRGRFHGVLDHLCDNKSCVNPIHLKLTSNRENVLRGTGMSARYARRTHCGKGHPLSGDNLRVTKAGRHCITCCRARALAYYYRTVAKKQALQEAD